MDLIYTLLFIVIAYYAYYKVIKPYMLDGGSIRTKINKNASKEGEYVDYEEVEDK